MRLLFDENLASSLPALVADMFPGAVHLRDIGMRGADDAEIWKYAAIHGFTLVTKDDDFRELSILRGAPPKLVMIGLGNCATREVAMLLRDRAAQMAAFANDTSAAMIELP